MTGQRKFINRKGEVRRKKKERLPFMKFLSKIKK